MCVFDMRPDGLPALARVLWLRYSVESMRGRPQIVGHTTLSREVNFMSDTDTTALEQVLVGMADPEIVSLEAQIRAAQLNADETALDMLISDDLLFTGPDGQLGTKAQDIEAYRSGTVRFLAHVPEELRIRRVGANVAITALRAQLTVDVAGNLSRGTYRYTRVWAREDDKTWRVVGGHVSLVRLFDGET